MAGRLADPKVRVWLSRSGAWLGRNWWHFSLVTLAAIAATTFAGATIRKEMRAERAYFADRRGDCYSIMARERDKFNNVEGGWYNPDADRCVVRYRLDEPDPSCRATLERREPPREPADYVLWWLQRRYDCETQTFRKDF